MSSASGEGSRGREGAVAALGRGRAAREWGRRRRERRKEEEADTRARGLG
jgi:hypothetical protein